MSVPYKRLNYLDHGTSKGKQGTSTGTRGGVVEGEEESMNKGWDRRRSASGVHERLRTYLSDSEVKTVKDTGVR